MTYRELYFSLKKENSKYINLSVIRELLCFLGKFSSNSELYLNFDSEMLNDNYLQIVEQLRQGVPIQYITNRAYFLGSLIYVNPDVLIPRQETEQLVIETSKIINEHFVNPINLIDIATGSGAILIGLNKYVSNNNITFFASDISDEALKIASNNFMNHKIDVKTYRSNMLKDIPSELKFDVVISNPPYIDKEKEIDEQVFRFEPHLALLAHPSTLYYEQILDQVRPFLAKKHLLAFEIGEDMVDSLQDLVSSYLPNDSFIFKKDIYGKYRFLYIYN